MTDKSKFNLEGYSLDITGRHLQITPAIEAYVKEKISKIEKFTNNILEIAVTLEVQKLAHTTAITIKFMHYRIHVHATTVDLYAAIDGAFVKLYKLLKKYKGKLQSNNKNKDHLSQIDIKVNVLKPIDDLEDINDEIDKENLKEELNQYKVPEIVAKESLPIRMLTQEEAMMKLDLSGEYVLIYKSEEDQKLKVLYKRPDEKLGMVEIG